MASRSTDDTEPNMSERGPRNFYCHQCNSRTRVSAEVSKIYIDFAMSIDVIMGQYVKYKRFSVDNWPSSII